MAALLIELHSEEIPAGQQKFAAEHLSSGIIGAFKKINICLDTPQIFYNPRRLTVHITGLPLVTKDISDQRRGPKVGCPDKALEGFINSCGVPKDALVIEETAKGSFYFANIHKQGQDIKQVISEFMPDIIENFPWKKSMRWGSNSLAWVRPLHYILCILTDDKGQGDIVPFKVGHLQSGNITTGHHFMNPQPLEINNFDDYTQKLSAANVVLCPIKRQEMITQQIDGICQKQNLAWIIDKPLLTEVTALVEYPVALCGRIDEKFHDLPAELLQTSMREHQKFFSVTEKNSDKITHFITIANVKTADNGATILRGNQRVLTARLSDGEYFYQLDLKTSLAEHLEKLKNVTFYAGLGSQYDRALRLEDMAIKLAPLLKVNTNHAAMAGRLCKADLVTQMVYEFPELQGVMGGYYAKNDGNSHLSAAIKDHYKPVGAFDDVPTDPLSLCISLVDKIDQLAGFWSIKQIPTSSKDPFALRRAALGIIRILLENKISISVSDLLSFSPFDFDTEHLTQFILERFVIYAKDRLFLQSMITPPYHLSDIYHKAGQLQEFLNKDSDLLAIYKRAVGVIPNDFISVPIEPDLFDTPQEQALYDVLMSQSQSVKQALHKDDYLMALGCFAKIKTSLFSFLDCVMINCEDTTLRQNRLSLLDNIQKMANGLADFSKIN